MDCSHVTDEWLRVKHRCIAGHDNDQRNYESRRVIEGIGVFWKTRTNKEVVKGA